MKNLFFLLIAFVCSTLIITGLSSCSEDNCSIAGRPMINGGIYTVNPTSGLTENDTIKTLTVTALGTDSIIINNQTNVLSLSLPLSYVSDTTVLVFHYDYTENPADADTLWVLQDNTAFFESIECGYSMIQSITGITHTSNQLSSISIINPNANVTGTENLRLFFHYSN